MWIINSYEEVISESSLADNTEQFQPNIQESVPGMRAI